MDGRHIGMLADSLGVPDTYLADVDPQEAGQVMLALCYFRVVGPHIGSVWKTSSSSVLGAPGEASIDTWSP